MTPKLNKAPLENSYYNRELSWLQFNARVLQEAEDTTTPLLERLRFIGIFSNNLDEFFKVRYATIKRIANAGKGGRSFLGGIPASELMELITQTVIKQQKTSLGILSGIKEKLKKEQIFMMGLLLITFLAAFIKSRKALLINNTFKKSWSLLLLNFLIVLGLFLFENESKNKELLFLFFPISLILANGIELIQKKIVINIFLYLFLIGCIGVLFSL